MKGYNKSVFHYFYCVPSVHCGLVWVHCILQIHKKFYRIFQQFIWSLEETFIATFKLPDNSRFHKRALTFRLIAKSIKIIVPLRSHHTFFSVFAVSAGQSWESSLWTELRIKVALYSNFEAVTPEKMVSVVSAWESSGGVSTTTAISTTERCFCWH